MTLGELARAYGDIKKRQDDFVSKEVYNNEIQRTRQDIKDIKASQTWAMRLLVGQFIALLIALLLYVLQQAPQL